METRKGWGIVFLAGGFAIVAIAVAFTTLRLEKSDVTTDVSSPIVITEKSASASLASDTDGDGLLNWQETLWGTNPNETDSDADGVSDGDEVGLGANPLRQGASPVTSVEPYRAPSGLASTDALARELFSEYAELKKTGGVQSTQAVDATLSELITRRVKEIQPEKNVALKDLTIKGDISVAVYEKNVSDILRKSLAVKEYELSTFARVMSDGDVSALQSLQSSALLYATLQNELMKTPVPSSLAGDHLRMVQSVGSIAQVVSLLSKWGGDPLDALVYVNAFAEAEIKVAENISKVFSLARSISKQS